MNQQIKNLLQSRYIVPELKNKWDANGNKTEGAWEEVFGKGFSTDEIFQAYYYVNYADNGTENNSKVPKHDFW